MDEPVDKGLRHSIRVLFSSVQPHLGPSSWATSYISKAAFFLLLFLPLSDSSEEPDKKLDTSLSYLAIINPDLSELENGRMKWKFKLNVQVLNFCKKKHSYYITLRQPLQTLLISQNDPFTPHSLSLKLDIFYLLKHYALQLFFFKSPASFVSSCSYNKSFQL